jgi:choline-phosphate cytidylyltransferase
VSINGGAGGDIPPSSPLGPAGGVGGAFPFPRSPPTGVATAGERATSTSNDFVTGYTLGLIGGVRSWVCLSPLDPCNHFVFVVSFVCF